ncbi:MAG: phosphoribosylformylglycinamidine cyclo-ligase, partial [Anaerolineae bacterium]
MGTQRQSAYAAAGVDIDTMMGALKAAKRRIKRTATGGVVSEVGNFGGLFTAPGDKTLLVSSIDGVGTKLKVAQLAGRHDTIGQCLVNHCVNDILVQGATPLFFMDYLGAARLQPAVFAEVIEGLCTACEENGCALIGGETAEMPGLYPDGEYDLVGAIVGVVKRKQVITGAGIREGDRLIGLASSGLHTNGYSLARKVIFEEAGLDCDDVMPGTSRRVDHVLLAVHRSYLHPVRRLADKVKIRGLAHITGGGLVDNIPRILPKGLFAEIDRDAWTIPPVFKFIALAGSVSGREMYRVFNMGIGMVIIVRDRDAETALKVL